MALPTFGSNEWNEVAAAHTFEFLKSDPRDQYFKKHPALAHMRSKQMTRDGGATWAWPILDGSDAVGRSYIGVQGLTPTDVKVATMAETKCSFIAEPIFISHTDAQLSGGGGKLFDLLETKTKHAKLRLSKAHSTYLFASSKTYTTDPDSIRLAIPIDPTANVAFNNLNGSSGNQTYWRNKTETSSGSFSSSTAGKLDDLLNSIAQEAGDPTLLVTTKAVFGYMQQFARGHYALNADVKTKAGKQMADLGIPTLNWNGIPVVHDSDCTAGVIYALNDDAIQWVANQGGDYTLMEPGFQSTSINGIMGSLGWLRLEGNLCVWERRALGQVDGTNAV